MSSILRLFFFTALASGTIFGVAAGGDFCGASFADANSRCATPCPSGTDAECKAVAGEKCFASTTCAAAPPAPAPTGGNFCGTSFADANSRCRTACPSGTDAECKAVAGEKCFAACSKCGAAPAPTPPAPGPPAPPVPTPAVPTPKPPGPHGPSFAITVEEIVDALTKPHPGHPLENLIIGKIMTILNSHHISVAGGSLAFDGTFPTLVVKNDTCAVHVQLDNGWNVAATLKPDMGVGIQLGVDQHALFVQARVMLDTSFHFKANVHLAEGSDKIHPKGKKCSIVATENAGETIDGDIKLGTNVTLHLKPYLSGNLTSGFHLGFTPTVAVAGELDYFKAKSQSALSVFGIPLTKIETLVNLAIDMVLSQKVLNKIIQKEFTVLQAKLQALLDSIWPAGSYGELPGLTPELLASMQSAISNISTAQSYQYP